MDGSGYDLLSAAFDQSEPSKEKVNDFIDSIQRITLTERRPQTRAQQEGQHAARRSAAPIPIRVIIPTDQPTLTFTGHQTLHMLQVNVMGNMGERLVDQLPVIRLSDEEIAALSGKNL